jgi:hypothetical protein
MNIDIIYENGGYDWCYKAVFKDYFEYCTKNTSDVNFNYIDSFSLRISDYKGNNENYGPFYLKIQNPENKKYILVSYWDKLKDITRHNNVTGFDLKNCVEIITSAGAYDSPHSYNPLNDEYTPFAYTTSALECEQIIEQIHKNTQYRTYPETLSFRGLIYEFRNYLTKDNRFNIIDKRRGGFLYHNEYLNELNNNHINLSLNGAGEICYRDIEILGLGTALIRFELVTQFHNKLIPDYHYISVPYKDIELKKLDEYYKQLSDRLFDRFEQVKNDKDFIHFIANNGRKWYEENGTVAANVKILTELIDFKKLL